MGDKNLRSDDIRELVLHDNMSDISDPDDPEWEGDNNCRNVSDDSDHSSEVNDYAGLDLSEDSVPDDHNLYNAEDPAGGDTSR